ncbi:hypothetical protein [Fusobacterium necrophorum]|uniref:Uncharacterized protein n=1 Tax=Fusobacterium necrophorum subsp. funduliforme TaxID=143387 RepID=A0A162J5K4_9FUSO|nr:hypothetical protein [Fusobacterium necrophorum]AVQ21346.1 hypothetical protein C4N15_06710 [Fusobacterium necrophorum subsp. funduliforme]KYL05178.1 hypothetical protein A2J07_00150 [Fusobacterium necrophorum subsp. funduliforme]MDK4525022.1 hypothetical protein [Fusobacterium necrophorum]
MLIDMIQLISQHGVLLVIGAWTLYFFFTFFERKTKKDEKTREDFDSILINQLREFQSSMLNYKADLSELKKLILNKTNMSVNDFEILCNSQNNMMLLQIQILFFQIIEQNHINKNNLEITLKKVQNIVDSVINKSIYNLNRLSYDDESIKLACKVQEEQKQTILESMEQILNTYVTSDSKFKDLDAKRSIEELMKFVGNVLTTEIYKVINE